MTIEERENPGYWENYYERLLVKLDQKGKKLDSISKRYSYLRLLLFLLGLILLTVVYIVFSTLIVISVLTIIVFSFLVLVHFHNKTDSARGKLKVWKDIKSVHLARIRMDWEKIPLVNYEEYQFDPIESDLNLTGHQSLHQLINTSVSKQGKDLLRKYLLIKDPSCDDILNRQKLVKELVPLQRFRDKLQLISLFPVKKEPDGMKLLSWLKKNNKKRSNKKYLAGLAILAPVNIVLFLLYIYAGLYPIWAFTLPVYISLYYAGNKKKKRLFDEFELLKDELGRFESVLEFVEKYPFPAKPGILKLCSEFKQQGTSPSYILKKISFAYNMLSIRGGNPFIWNIIRLIFPADFYFDYKLETYKEIISDRLEKWLNVWYEFEALNSLANFAALNPHYKFPVIIRKNPFTVKAEFMGHPLIKENKKVCNNFELTESGEIFIITGSNMSGKSTFLRTLGTNILLSYAGAPVNATLFECSLFRLFTCIKVSDSVVDGISYFYAEVKRLKLLLDEARNDIELPLFFLIDEIFRGTNNIERLKGSTAFIKALSLLNTAGIIATHDLELIKLEATINKIKNFHFREQIINDKMSFDYKIQNGPCPTTNALKIMEIEGLPVSDLKIL